MILTRQTCGQRLSMPAGGKCRALAFYFSTRICCMFQVSKCTEESDLDLCTTAVLAKRMTPRISKFQQILRPNTFCNNGSWHRAVACVLRESKCGEESDLGLCTAAGLAKKMPLRSANFPSTNFAAEHVLFFIMEVGTAQPHSFCKSRSCAQT